MMCKNRDIIIKNVFKNKGDSVVNCPVSFLHIINNIQGQNNINSNSITVHKAKIIKINSINKIIMLNLTVQIINKINKKALKRFKIIKR